MLTTDAFYRLPKVHQRIAFEVAAGQTNASIAKKMHLSPSTIANYLSQMYEQVGCPNRTSLAGQLGTIITAHQEVSSNA